MRSTPPAETPPTAPPNIWQADYRVRSYEVDARGLVSVPCLCHFFQDAASGHAQSLGVSVDQLAAENLTWVLYRLTLEMDAYCRWQETVRVRTWPSGSQGLFALRDFTFHDGEDRPLGAGFSQWLVIDLDKRRPLRIAPIARRLHPIEGRWAMPHETAAPPPPAPVRRAIPITVGYDDLDINQHVNNVRYIQWVLDTVPPDRRRQAVLRRLEIQFKAEALAGQTLAARRLAGDVGSPRIDHDIVAVDDNREVARAVTWWQSHGQAHCLTTMSC